MILRNTPVAVGPLTETDDDLGFVWRYASSVGPIAVKRLGSEKDWVYWICLAMPPY